MRDACLHLIDHAPARSPTSCRPCPRDAFLPARAQAYGVLGILSAQGLRFLQTSITFGPLVIMVLQMATVDLGQWLVLTIVAVQMPFIAALYLIFSAARETALEGECADVDTRLGDLTLNAWALLKVLIGGGGDAYVDCLEQTANAVGASTLFLAYLLLTVVLLLNLLIAQFGNTFTNIFEKATQNFQFGFGRIVLKAAQLWMVPPPLNLLGALYALVVVGRFVRGKCLTCKRGDGFERMADDAAEQGEGEAAAKKAKKRAFDLDLTLEEGYEEDERDEDGTPTGTKLLLYKAFMEANPLELKEEASTSAAAGEDEDKDKDGAPKTLVDKLLAFMGNPENEEEQEGKHRRQLRKSIGEVKQNVGKVEAQVETKVGKVEAKVTFLF